MHGWRKGHGEGCDAKEQDAAEKGGAAAEMVADDAAERGTEGDANESEGEDEGKAGVGDAPFFGDGGDGEAHDLYVHALEDDGDGGEDDGHLLAEGPAAGIQQYAKFDGVHGAEGLLRAMVMSFRVNQAEIC